MSTSGLIDAIIIGLGPGFFSVAMIDINIALFFAGPLADYEKAKLHAQEALVICNSFTPPNHTILRYKKFASDILEKLNLEA